MEMESTANPFSTQHHNATSLVNYSMAQLEKVRLQTEIKSPAEKFYEILRRRTHLLPKICPSLVRDIQVLQGDWETVGSVRQWSYYGAGDPATGKETVKAVNDQNLSITFGVLDGEVMKYYKSFTSTVQIVGAAEEDKGSLVTWTLEYEKQSEDVPAPHKYLDFVACMTRDIDAYLLRAA